MHAKAAILLSDSGKSLQVVKPVELGAPLADEHYIMDDNKYIADIMADFKSVKTREYQSKILFKKRMFRETDETITEPQFITLSYVQVCNAFQLRIAPVMLPAGLHASKFGSCLLISKRC